MATSWSKSPRDLSLGVYCYTLSGGTDAGSEEVITDVLTSDELLAKQAADALGTKLWGDIETAMAE